MAPLESCAFVVYDRFCPVAALREGQHRSKAASDKRLEAAKSGLITWARLR